MIDNGCADGTHLRTGAVVLAVSRKPAVATQGAAGHLLVRHTRPVCMHSPAMRSVLQASPPIPSRSEITTAREMDQPCAPTDTAAWIGRAYQPP
jgi:hypothetical protein